MPTKTKPVGIADLAKLEAERAKAQAVAREKRDAKQSFEAEVHDLRARYAGVDPTSPEGRKLRGEIQARELSRIHSQGPRADAYAEAREAFHEQDLAANAWRREHLDELIEEVVDGEVRPAFEGIVTCLEQLLGYVQVHDAGRDKVRDLIVGTAPLNGQDLAFDPRIDELRRVAARMLEEPFTEPRLTDFGAYRLSQVEGADRD